MSTTTTDLSPYEIARLQRIKENHAVLAKIGLKKLNLPSLQLIISNKKKNIQHIKARERRKRTNQNNNNKRKNITHSVVRRSKRLCGQPSEELSLSYDKVDGTRGKRAHGDGGENMEEEEVDEEVEEEEEESRINYEDGNWPQDPSCLDDFEFQVYAELKQWRLLRKNELNIEAYKICQNRTMCEMIRRRRNNSNYAAQHKSCEEVENDLLVRVCFF